MKYKRILQDGSIDEVNGTGIKIAKYPGFKFYMYRNKSGVWRCCEASVGCIVGSGETHEEAVARAKRQLAHYAPTQKKFQKMLDDVKSLPVKYTPFDRDLRRCFMEAFGVAPMRFLCEVSSVVDMAQRIDIVRFDKWLQKKYKYEDGKTSCREFIKNKFGTDVENAVRVFGGLS